MHPDPSPIWPTLRMRLAYHPFFVAVIVTLLNAMKPAVVDDTAYLTFARHIAAHPTNPYGFELFWYADYEPAMHILAPPVLPYWLGLGIAIFGESLVVLKLWLLPFLLILAYSIRSIGAKLYEPLETFLQMKSLGPEKMTGLLLYSAAIFPHINVMLDIPALALGLAAVALMLRGGWLSAVLAGLVCGLAMQTKYSAFTIPCVLALVGILERRKMQALSAILIAVAIFAGWELWLFSKYGESHFLWNLRNDASGDPLATQLIHKLSSVKLLMGPFGFLTIGFVLATSPRRMVWTIAAIFTLAGFVFLMLAPGDWGVLLRDSRTGQVRLHFDDVYFRTLGILCVSVIGWRVWNARSMGWDSHLYFVIAWLLVEFAATVLMSPFPATRRVIGMSIVSAILLMMLTQRPYRPLNLIGILTSLIMGMGLFWIDHWDSHAEPELADASHQFILRQDSNGTIWFNGHWGFQYECERLSMKPVIPEKSILSPGDWLVFPRIPDRQGFYRPYHGGAEFQPDLASLRHEHTFIWDDWIGGQTIPNLYGGDTPVTGRFHPRLTVDLYRVTKMHCPQRLEPPR